MPYKNISVGIVSEGITDQYVLNIMLNYISCSSGIDFSVRAIQPKYDEISNTWSRGGWGIIYTWCKDTIETHGSIESYIANVGIDILIIQLDADVVYKSYSDCSSISPKDGDYKIPIDVPCPTGDCNIPCHAIVATNDLLKNWLSSANFPHHVIFCIPSKSIDAWVVATMPLSDFRSRGTDTSLVDILSRLECTTNPEQCFDYSDKIGKSLKSYKRYYPTIIKNIEFMFDKCIMAERFKNSFSKALEEVANA